jgi:bacterioferritin-associated ferredoxin
MIICLCLGVSAASVQAAIAEGAQTIERVARACGAGTGCGACHGMIEDLLRNAEVERGTRRARAWGAQLRLALDGAEAGGSR